MKAGKYLKENNFPNVAVRNKLGVQAYMLSDILEDYADNVYKNATEDLKNLLKKRGWDDEASKAGRNKWHKLYIESQQQIKELKEVYMRAVHKVLNSDVIEFDNKEDGNNFVIDVYNAIKEELNKPC